MLHLVKLTIGCDSPEDLQHHVTLEHRHGRPFVRTRSMPKRIKEILPPATSKGQGGSLYRVISGLIQCRQPILGFEPYQREDGHTGTHILVSDRVILTQPRPMRAFQGWRYLKEEDAPPDLFSEGHTPSAELKNDILPASLRKRLAELALP